MGTGRIQGLTTDAVPRRHARVGRRVRRAAPEPAIQWIKYVDGTGDAVARSVAVSATGQVAIAGEFSGSGLPFYPAAQGTTDCFLAFFAAATGQLQAMQRSMARAAAPDAISCTFTGTGKFDGALTVQKAPGP